MPAPNIRKLMRARYPAPEWAFMEEVAPRTGGGTGYADAVAVNLWSSRGHAVHGFEFKISRSDWLRELKQPAKAEGVYAFCDFWWLVAPKDVLKEGELPVSWGFIEASETRLVLKKDAPKLDPKPITRSFFASLVRRGLEAIDDKVADRCKELNESVDKRVHEEVEREVAYRTRHHKSLEEQVAKFVEETGLSLNDYRGPSHAEIKLAQALSTLDDWNGDGGVMVRLRDQLMKTVESLDDAIVARVAVGPGTQG